MEAKAFNVRFSAGPRLAENEWYWPWDEDCWGTAQFATDAISLNGKHKMGIVGNVMTLGPLQPLLKRAAAKDLTEVIPIADLARVVITQRPGKKTAAFKLYQKRDDGTLAVHSFVTGLTARKDEPASAEAIASLIAIVPAGIVTFEGTTPVGSAAAANWYPDPSGSHQLRYWDGAAWTAHVADDGLQSVDPLQAER